MRIEEVEGDRIDIRPEIQGGRTERNSSSIFSWVLRYGYLKNRLYYGSSELHVRILQPSHINNE